MKYNFEYLSDDQKQCLSDYLNAFCNNFARKGDLIDFLKKYDENFNEYDTALPLSHIEDLKRWSQNFDQAKYRFFHVVEYSDLHPMGEILNLPQRAVEVLRSIISR